MGRRDDIDDLKAHLTSLGADHVLTYSEFLERETRSKIKEWTQGGDLKLALNCVGGKETSEMVKLLGAEGFLGEQRDLCSLGAALEAHSSTRSVTYGGMAKTALSIPPSLFIFKQFTAYVLLSPVHPPPALR